MPRGEWFASSVFFSSSTDTHLHAQRYICIQQRSLAASFNFEQLHLRISSSFLNHTRYTPIYPSSDVAVVASSDHRLRSFSKCRLQSFLSQMEKSSIRRSTWFSDVWSCVAYGNMLAACLSMHASVTISMQILSFMSRRTYAHTCSRNHVLKVLIIFSPSACDVDIFWLSDRCSSYGIGDLRIARDVNIFFNSESVTYNYTLAACFRV